MTQPDTDTAAWKLLLMYAESGVEDDIDEEGEYTPEQHEAVTERAMQMIRELREAGPAYITDGTTP